MIKSELTILLKEQLTFPESKNLQQRGIADKIEARCNEIIEGHFSNVAAASSRKSTEDISIGDTYIDHKTSDEALDFKMPNMISVETLRKLTRELIYNFVIYNSERKEIVDTFALSLYELNWDHLAIQNLGTGQLQIKNMKEFLKSPKSTMSKEEWRGRLQAEVTAFYEKLIAKTKKRQKDWIQWK